MKSKYYLFFCFIMCSFFYANAEYGFGNSTISFNEYNINSSSIKGTLTIKFNDPNFSVSVNGKTYTYNVERLTQYLDGSVYFFYTSKDDDDKYLMFAAIDGKISYIYINTSDFSIYANDNHVDNITSASSLISNLSSLKWEKIEPKVTFGKYSFFSIFDDDELIISYFFLIERAKNKKIKISYDLYDSAQKYHIKDQYTTPESNYEEDHRTLRIDASMLSDGNHKLKLVVFFCEDNKIEGFHQEYDLDVNVKNGKFTKTFTKKSSDW